MLKRNCERTSAKRFCAHLRPKILRRWARAALAQGSGASCLYRALVFRVCAAPSRSGQLEGGPHATRVWTHAAHNAAQSRCLATATSRPSARHRTSDHQSIAIRSVSHTVERKQAWCKADEVSMASHTDFRRLANPCTPLSAHADWAFSLSALDGEGEAWTPGACVTEFWT
jgi:hypothetical protein